MLLAIAGIILLLWIGGFVLNIVGSVVHVLLVLALVVAAVHFWQGTRNRTV